MLHRPAKRSAAMLYDIDDFSGFRFRIHGISFKVTTVLKD
jgi:hypothetical protein